VETEVTTSTVNFQQKNDSVYIFFRFFVPVVVQEFDIVIVFTSPQKRGPIWTTSIVILKAAFSLRPRNRALSARRNKGR
jgi:hypothetical protein